MDEGEKRPGVEGEETEGSSPGRDESESGSGAEPESTTGAKEDSNADGGDPGSDDSTDGTDRTDNADSVDEADGAEEEPDEELDGNPDEQSGTAGGEPARGPGRKTAKALVRSAVALLSVIALGVTGYAYSALDVLQDNVNTTDALQQDDEPDDEDSTPPEDDEDSTPPEDDGATDILLVGTDSRTDMEGNPLPPHVLEQLRTENKPGVSTDTLILLRIPHDGSSPTGISIPRDTWVSISDDEHAKINSVYGTAKYQATDELRREGVTDHSEVERESDQAGRAALVRTVQRFTQVRIDHYAEVNLLGFYLLTEALDGVEVCLNHPTFDPDSGANFAAGRQTVSGGEALSFVRQRNNLPRGDLDRIQRQQAFLASALNKVLSAGTLTDIDKLEKLADTLRRSLVLDADLDLLKFAGQTRGIASGDFSFVTIPVVDIAAWSPDGEQSIVQVDVEKVREFIADAVADGEEASQDGERTSGGGSTPQSDGGEITSDGVTCVN
ncbi:LCP family protein [Saccharomonospora sp.]|uniref:LCP family protein n=1 Tax=Saccharomonospora sp. TaxID=33913 RepID=UPI00263776A4|nr:LCP family protein [Saccharomonospora sp.]